MDSRSESRAQPGDAANAASYPPGEKSAAKATTPKDSPPSAPTPRKIAAATGAAVEQDRPDARNSLRHILAGDPASEPSTPKAQSALPSTSAAATAAAAQPPPTLASATVSSTTTPAPLQPRLPELAMASTPGSTAGDSAATAPAPAAPAAAPTTPAAAQATPSSTNKPLYTANPTTTRRNANGSVSSVYSGNKIRHLKKEDGVPLWRKDIQYDFLKFVFEDDKKVFHKASDGTYGHSFADIYLDAMAKSSKCSKILKDKLLTERPAALNMAMVCLLVNVGRMNTTLNFFPEMRAQLRTYHSIPSLQARQDPNAYKQLQDAPRLKSILKGATEDTEQPSTLEDIRAASIPRTNPVNLIFVLSQYAPKISEMHFDVPRDFFDLVMKPNLSSRSRATAFLWLMWWYLESDFSTKDALENPYGPGRRSREGDEREMPIKCPQFDYLNDEQEALENVDSEEEKEFGDLKKKERESILMADFAPVVTGPKRTSKKGTLNSSGIGVFSMASDNDPASPARDFNSPAPSQAGRTIKAMHAGSIKEEGYDSDQTRSASPTGSYATLPHQPGKTSAPGMRVNALLNDDAPTPPATSAPAPAPKGPGRGNWGHRRKAENIAAANAAAAAQLQRQDESTPGAGGSLAARPHGYYIPLNGQIVEPKRSRPLTVHQQAVERYRMENVNYILDRGLRDAHVKAKRRRTKDTGTVARAWKRCRALPDMYDSEDEMPAAGGAAGPVGALPGNAPEALAAARALVMMASLKPCPWELSDWGEEAANLASGIRKVRRRTERWDSGAPVVRRRDAPGGEDVPVASRDDYDDMDLDGEGDGDGDDGIERSSLPDRDELDEDEMEDLDGEDGVEYANGNGNGHRRVSVVG